MSSGHRESLPCHPPDNFLYVFKTGPAGPERARRRRTPRRPSLRFAALRAAARLGARL
jgi:hypothetical protein